MPVVSKPDKAFSGQYISWRPFVTVPVRGLPFDGLSFAAGLRHALRLTLALLAGHMPRPMSFAIARFANLKTKH